MYGRIVYYIYWTLCPVFELFKITDFPAQRPPPVNDHPKILIFEPGSEPPIHFAPK
jgi:hypothetical protein